MAVPGRLSTECHKFPSTPGPSDQGRRQRRLRVGKEVGVGWRVDAGARDPTCVVCKLYANKTDLAT